MFSKKYWIFVVVSIVIPASASGQDDDMVGWIRGACPAKPEIADIQKIHVVVRRAIERHLREEELRTTLSIAEVFMDCLRRGEFPEMEEEKSRLMMLLCHIPVIIFEKEGRVDEELARKAFERCPQPPTDIPEENTKEWIREFHRYALTLAAVFSPAEVYTRLLPYLGALGVTLKPNLRVPDTDSPGQQVDSTLQMILLYALIGSGNLDALIESGGGEIAVCNNFLLWIYGVMPILDNESSAIVVLRHMLSKVSLADLMRTMEEARTRFKKYDNCIIPKVVATIALSSRPPELVDQDMALQEAIVPFVAEADLLPKNYKPATQIRIIEKLLNQVSDASKTRWLCMLADMKLEEKDLIGARKSFEEVASRPEGRSCGYFGIVRTTLEDAQPSEDSLQKALKDYLAFEPSASDLTWLMRNIQKDSIRLELVKALLSLCNKKKCFSGFWDLIMIVVQEWPGSEAANEALKALMKGYSKKAPSFYMIASQHFAERKNIDEAKKAIDEAFKRRKKNMQFFYLFDHVWMERLISRGHYEIVDYVIEKAERIGLLNIEVICRIAEMLVQADESSRASALLKKVERMKIYKKSEWIMLANTYVIIDELDKAEAALARVGPQAKWGAECWMTKGHIESAAKRFREAVVAFSKAIDAIDEMPNRCNPYFFRGLVRLLMGEPEQAEKDFYECIEMHEITPSTLGGIGYALFDQSRYEDAEESFRKALEMDAGNPDNIVGLAMVLLRRGKTEEAIDMFKKAIEKEPYVAKGYEAMERKGYVYSDIEKKAWDELVEKALQRTEK